MIKQVRGQDKEDSQCVQLFSIYLNRAMGCYFQKQGIYVILNIRWGDERTINREMFRDKVAFLGVEKHSIESDTKFSYANGIYLFNGHNSSERNGGVMQCKRHLKMVPNNSHLPLS